MYSTPIFMGMALCVVNKKRFRSMPVSFHWLFETASQFHMIHYKDECMRSPRSTELAMTKFVVIKSFFLVKSFFLY